MALLKIFLWKNNCADSDFTQEPNISMPDSSNAHSGGIVVLAESKEEAIKLLVEKQYILPNEPLRYNDYWEEDAKEIINPDPIVIPLDAKGVIIFCSGDC